MNQDDMMKEQLLDEIAELNERLKQQDVKLKEIRVHLAVLQQIYNAVRRENFVMAMLLAKEYEATIPF